MVPMVAAPAKTSFEECTAFIGALMTDITAAWYENAAVSLPLTDYREATGDEKALFAFKRSSDVHADEDTDGACSQPSNRFVAFAMQLKKLSSEIAATKEARSFAGDIFMLFDEAPKTQFSEIADAENKYTKLVQENKLLQEKQALLEDEIQSLQMKLSVSEHELIRSDEQLAQLEAEVDLLELELQRSMHGQNKKN